MSFPRYPAYKDSGVEWLGEVPEHWSVTPLKYLASFVGGGTPNREALEYWHGAIPWVSPKDMKAESIDDTEERITDAGLASSATTLIPSGAALLVVRSGILKHTIPVAINQCPVTLNQDMKALRFQPSNMYAAFFLRFVQGMNDTLLLQWSKQGATVESLEHDYLANSEVPTPPLDEQNTIAAFLDRETAKIDALVGEQEKLIELLKEKRQAVISHAVTKGLDPSVPMKDSGVEWLGEVPAHWEVAPLKYCAAFVSGGTPNKSRTDYWDGDVPWASAKDLKSDVLFDTIDHITNTAVTDGAASAVEAGSTLVVVRGMILARHFPVSVAAVPMAINQDLKAVVTNARMSRSFLPWLLKGMQNETLNRLDEAGHGTKALRMDAWTSMAVAIPPLEEQLTLANRLKEMTGHLEAMESEADSSITLLQERRSALISAAVTGQIDVRGLAARTVTLDLIAARADSTPTQGRFDSESTVRVA